MIVGDKTDKGIILGIDLALTGPTGMARLTYDRRKRCVIGVALLPSHKVRRRRSRESVADYHLYLAQALYERLRDEFQTASERGIPVTHVIYEITDWNMRRGSRQGGIGRDRIVLTSLGEAKGLLHAALYRLREEGYAFVPVAMGTRDVKRRLTGNANARKEQVAKAVRVIAPKLKRAETGDKLDDYDAAALALALALDEGLSNGCP